METSRYLYRAKMKGWKESGLKNWAYGAYFKFLTYTPYPVNPRNIKEEDYRHLMVCEGPSDWGMPRDLQVLDIDLETLCQCIGLKDSNNVPIYENDIVRYKPKEDTEWSVATVKWGDEFDYPAFDLDRAEIFDCNALSHIFNCDYLIEVIGNEIDENSTER